MPTSMVVVAVLFGLAPGVNSQQCPSGKMCPDPDGGNFTTCTNASYGPGKGCGYECYDPVGTEYFCDSTCGNCHQHQPPGPAVCPSGKMCPDPDGGSFAACVNHSYGLGKGCGYECYDAKGLEYYCDNKCGECKHGAPPAPAVCPNGKMCTDPSGGSFATCVNHSYGPGQGCGYECYDAKGLEYYCDNNCGDCKAGAPPAPAVCPNGKMCPDPAGGSFAACVNHSYGPGKGCGYECYDAKGLEYYCSNTCGDCKAGAPPAPPAPGVCPNGPMCPDPAGGSFAACVNHSYGPGKGCGYECYDAKGLEYYCNSTCGDCKAGAPPAPPAPGVCPSGKMCPDPDGGSFAACVNHSYGPGKGCGYECYTAKGTEYYCDNKCANCKTPPPPPPTNCHKRMCTDPDGGSFATCMNVSYGPGAGNCGYECYNAKGTEYYCNAQCEKCGHPPVQQVALATLGLPDCSTVACPATCTCAETKCTSELEACLADPSCAAGQSCVDKCACGSTLCLLGCAAKHASAKGAAALKCLEANCKTEDMLPLTAIVV